MPTCRPSSPTGPQHPVPPARQRAQSGSGRVLAVGADVPRPNGRDAPQTGGAGLEKGCRARETGRTGSAGGGEGCGVAYRRHRLSRGIRSAGVHRLSRGIRSAGVRRLSRGIRSAGEGRLSRGIRCRPCGQRAQSGSGRVLAVGADTSRPKGRDAPQTTSAGREKGCRARETGRSPKRPAVLDEGATTSWCRRRARDTRSRR